MRLDQAVRDQVLAPIDTTSAAANVTSASRALTAARALLTEAQQGALTYLPSSEVLYLSGLPRRVDDVTVKRGSIITASVMRVSGATLVVSGSAAETDAKLLAVGDRAVITMPDDSEHGATITTIEGIANPDGTLSALQEGFRQMHGLQCGFCTPGMILRAHRLLQENPNPTEEEIRFGISGNLCRCTGYQNIVRAIQYAAAKINGEALEAAE